MIHYIYKIHFLCGYPSGRYYLGKRTFKGKDIAKDSYSGSGNFCFAYFKKYGKIEGETYIKEILEINPSKKINARREKIVIGDLYKTDPLCMNLMPGGLTERMNESHPNKNKVRQYNLNGDFIKEWDSISEAESELQINNIGACCSKKRHIAGNSIWRYASEGLDHVDPREALPGWSRAVYQCDLQGNIIAKYDQMKKTEESSGVKSKGIQECCAGRQQTAGGYIWKYVDPSYISKYKRDLSKIGAIKVGLYNLNWELEVTYESINIAAKAFNKSPITLAKWARKGKMIDDIHYIKLINK